MDPLVSVIMPAYNAAAYIRESIASVQAQTFSNWELLVVDDGSLDNTKFVVNELTKEDSRIKYIFQVNKKQGAARNNGIRHSKGKYVAFLDADDLWYSQKLELQVKVILSNKVDLVFSECSVFYNVFVNSEQYSLYSSCKGYMTVKAGLDSMLFRNCIPILTVMVSRSALDSVDLFSEDASMQTAEDYHLWLKLLFTGCVFYGMNETLAAYRVHANSVTGVSKSSVKGVLHAQHNLAENFIEYKNLLKNNIIEMLLHKLDNNLNNESLIFKELIECLDFANLKIFKPYFIFLNSIKASKTTVRSYYLMFRIKKLLKK